MTLAAEAPTKGNGGHARTVVRCAEALPSWMPPDVLDGMPSVGEAFDKSGTFMRWLFKQPRGAGVEQSTLITTWREAKPCVEAVVAAMTGDNSALRPDAKRPMLQPVRQASGLVQVAVGQVIVVVEPPRKGVAVSWSRGLLSSLDIVVVASLKDFLKAFHAGKAARAVLQASKSLGSTPNRQGTPDARLPPALPPPGPLPPAGLHELKSHVPPPGSLAPPDLHGIESRLPPPGLHAPTGLNELKSLVAKLEGSYKEASWVPPGLPPPPPGLPPPRPHVAYELESLAAKRWSWGEEALASAAPQTSPSHSLDPWASKVVFL